MNTKLVYLDDVTNSSPEVITAVTNVLKDWAGNPKYIASTHARRLVEMARKSVAKLAGVSAADIHFTRSGTESIHCAIAGVASIHPGKHVIISDGEHAATLQAVQNLVSAGYEVTTLHVFEDGTFSIYDLEKAIRPDTAMVSLLWASNETGVVFPIETVSELCRRHNVFLHIDASQAFGMIPVKASLADLMSFSGHKLHGPNGVGALYVRPDLNIKTVTSEVPSIVGFGIAADQAFDRIEKGVGRELERLRDRMEAALENGIPCLKINGRKADRLPNISSLTISGVNATQIVSTLNELGFCISASPNPSPLLAAMGLDPQEIESTIRIGLDHSIPESSIYAFKDALESTVTNLRNAKTHQCVIA